MYNTIQYGPHLFPWGPEPYIRKSNPTMSNWDAHTNIIHTLVSAFNKNNSESIISQTSKKFNVDSDIPIKISFMNYGDMQLIYLVTLPDKSKVVASINQPHIPLGKVKEEFDNLQRLVDIDSCFVTKPLAYFAMEDRGHELYISEYVDNAMCIAVNTRHGIYDPLPEYHFEIFSPEISHRVNTSMIALLVNYYDSENGRGLSKTQISGNDFILTRDFEKNNLDSVQLNMKIIAARDFIDISLDEYLNRLRQEFLFGTNRDDPSVVNGQIQINIKSKLPMTEQEIEEGITFGLKLREQ